MRFIGDSHERRECQRELTKISQFYHKLKSNTIHRNAALHTLELVPDWQVRRSVVFVRGKGSGSLRQPRYALYSPWRKTNTKEPCFEGDRDEALSWLREHSSWKEDAREYCEDLIRRLRLPPTKLTEMLDAE